MNNNNLHRNDDELNDAPLLRSLRNSQGFEAPDGYFDRLSSDIQDRINQPKSLISFRWKPVLAFASITGLAIFIYFSVFRSEIPSAEEQQIAQTEITSEDLIASDYYTEIDEELLTEALSGKDAGEIWTGNNTEPIEEYLIETSTEEELINEL